MSNIITNFYSYVKENKSEYIIKKVSSFKTDEGRFSVYDIENNPKKRSKMFTVFEDRNGWIVRNAIIPDDLQRKGIATNFYIQINKDSIKKTGHPLKSTQPRMLASGIVVHELSNDGIALWDSFVAKGLATKLGDKNYIFK